VLHFVVYLKSRSLPNLEHSSCCRAMDLDALKTKFGFREPDRGLDQDATGVTWRYGSMPDYTVANTSFLQGKTQNHKAGQDPILRLLNLQLQRQRCSRLVRFFK
jgi:hypothetical protein